MISGEELFLHLVWEFRFFGQMLTFLVLRCPIPAAARPAGRHSSHKV